MPLIKVAINGNPTDFKNLQLHISWEEKSDLFSFFTKEENGFFKILINTKPQLTNKIENRYEFIGSPYTWAIGLQKIKFDTKTSTIIPTKYYSNDLEDLSHQILLHIGENLIEWNKNFISTFSNENINLKFETEVEKNSYLNSLYRNVIKADEFWYNKHSSSYNQNMLTAFNELISNIDSLQSELLLETPSIPSIDSIPYPKFNFLDRLLGDDKIRLNIYEDSINQLKAKIETIEKRLLERESLNNLFKNQLREIKVILEEKIKNIKYELSGVNTKRINDYENLNDLKTFIDFTLKYSVLNSLYDFKFNFDILSDGHLICEVSLLNDEQISKIKSFKEYKRDDRIEPVYYNERDFKKLYDSILYSLYFRVVIEIFKSDYCSHIKRLSLNGWVNALNKKNGKYENKCIMSLSISREQFEDIDFTNVDLKEAFRHLKGISAASLIDFVPIAPIMSINKSDKRFIQSEEVLKNISDSTNIAAVDWEEFEHLVRELFEKEFAVNGGEVKVTQSSRDGGVDAIAFDPDPIRGGKIVIQSKRYTNVVGVSAIRDLYGTVLNEGATKGIIVTTSHYGSDAYEFAKGKPLTLLDGNNLLALLQKHGYNARINIDEAKKLNKE